MRRLVISILFSGLCLSGRSTPAMELAELYQEARGNDPAFLAAELRYQARQEEVRIARSRLLPDLSVTGQSGLNYMDRTSDAPFVTTGEDDWPYWGAGILLTQPLYDREKRLELKKSRLEEEMARTDFHKAEMELALRTVSAYVHVLTAQDHVELAKAKKAAHQELMDLAGDRLEVGLATPTDVAHARAGLEMARIDEIKADHMLADALHHIRQIIGYPIDNVARLRDHGPTAPPNPADVQEWFDRVEQNNPDIRVSKIEEERAQLRLYRQQAGRRPVIELVLNYGQDDQRGSVAGGQIETRRMDAHVRMRVPLYSGGGVSAGVRSAAILMEEAAQQTERKKRVAVQDTHSTYMTYVTAAREIDAYRQVVDLREEALENELQDFNAGMSTSLDVLNAQSGVFQARRDYLDARYRWIKARCRLYYLAGALGSDTLHAVSTWLE